MGPIFSHCECEEHGSAEEKEFHLSKQRKGKRRGEGEMVKCLEEKKCGFQDGSTNLPKTTNGFCWFTAFVRCNRLR